MIRKLRLNWQYISVPGRNQEASQPAYSCVLQQGALNTSSSKKPILGKQSTINVVYSIA
jgi:hypothetical protein